MSYSVLGADSTDSLLLQNIGGGFTPESISGLQLWLDASDSSTISLSGSDVASWTDKSTNAYTVSEATNRPSIATAHLNSLDGIFFDGTEILAGSTSALQSGSAFSVVIVAATNSDAGTTPIVSMGKYGDSDLRWSNVKSASEHVYFWVTSTGTDLNQVASAAGEMQIADGAIYTHFEFNGSGRTLYTKDTTSSGGGFTPHTTSGMIYMGAVDTGTWSGFTGWIYEIIVYDNVMSSSDRAALKSYLDTKWGLS